ncbi:solute carrier family 12 member 8-like [Daphnia pulicaria]|uniref:solute carrier family 12 member 8-like n=1 Tax=Daphnia pulicaria TaxID=35523 RepID=UPI001EEC80C3|nr:solute carrier family 12 member 8-like [Daphnia pulicaria]
MANEARTDRRPVDWARFGLSSEQNSAFSEVQFANKPSVLDESSYGGQAIRDNELYTEEQGEKPWWKSNFFISQPVLFGTWDGVFTSVMVNIFGVIIFLRSGWVVAQAGIGLSILLVFCTVGIILVSVLSAIGIIERCKVESGGVYFLLSYVLGSRIAAAVGLLYCFGQAVGGALCLMGFAESIAGLIEVDAQYIPWVQRGLATVVVFILASFNIAGVKWVIKLQFLLLFAMLLAAVDFIIGSFVNKPDLENGFIGWSTELMANNTGPAFTEGENWFTVLGVYFPTVTGVMAGINMSGDLRNPSRDIPNGTLSAIGLSCFLYTSFILILGSTCVRDLLYTNYLIAAKVSALEVLFFAGLYISSLSSSLGTFYGTPRVLQSIASQKVIPFIRVLANGRGPNRVPVYALMVAASVTLLFIWVGQLNTLAPIVTMPFLLTYATIDYAYFALAQSFNIQQAREERFRQQASTKTLTAGGPSTSYGSTTAPSRFDSGDLDELFPERVHHRSPSRELSLSPTSPVPGEDLPTAPASQVGSAVTSPASASNKSISEQQQKKINIGRKSTSWYSLFLNRWVSFFGFLVKIAMMFFVHWVYALVNLAVVFLVWFYIGRANPGVAPGVTADFRFFTWFQQGIAAMCGRKPKGYEEIVVTSVDPHMDTEASQLTEENEDFASRSRYHQTSTVRGRNLDDRPEDELALVP